MSSSSSRREPSQDPPTATPPPSVRVKTQTLDRFLSAVGEVILSSSQLRASADTRLESKNLAGGLDRMDRVVGELQRRAVEMRTTPLLRILEPLRRVAREVAQLSDKRVEVEIRGSELDLDRSILDRLSDPLVHLVRNAVDHGIGSPAERVASGKSEVGHVRIEARREKDSIRIAVSDDGEGIDLESVLTRAVEQGLVVPDLAEDLAPEDIAAFVFHPGLSTAGTVSRTSGRGVGMDAVRARIESLGGQVELTTEPGVGTTTTLVVPITAAVQSVLLVQVAGETLAIPIRKVERVVEVDSDQIERTGTEAFVLIDDDPVPVLLLAERMGLAERTDLEAREMSGPLSLVLTTVRGERVALLVERVAGQQQIYVKPPPALLVNVRAAAGLTILGDGRPVFLLDLNQLA